MSNKKTLAKIIALLLVIASIIPIILFSASASVPYEYDLSRPGSLNTVTLNGADILERLLGEELGEAERLYLISYGDLEIKYDDGITTSYVGASCVNGVLSVSAREYSYQTEKGTAVTWIPISAEINGQTQTLTKEEDGYVATFEGVSTEDEDAAVKVVYSLNIQIDKDKVNSLINLAYSDASQLKEERDAAISEYETATKEYNEAKIKYDAYVLALEKYEGDLKLYNEYLSAKRVYDLRLERYNKYLAAKAVYDAKLAIFNEYREKLLQYEENFKKYNEYRNAYIEYENDLNEYNAVMVDYNKCKAQLAIIESTMTPMTSLGRYIYSDVCLSTLVDMVLDQRDAYEKEGRYDVSPKALDLAEECTALLRILLNDYFSLETEAAKYNYYTANYESFKKGFSGLFQSLYYFVNTKNSVLVGDLENLLKMTGQSTDKVDKLMILISMLYTVTSAITDGPVYTIDPSLVKDKDSDYTRTTVTYSNFKCYFKSYSAIMERESPYLADTDSAKPTGNGFPTVTEAPVMPEKVEEPTPPKYVAEPTAPKAVDDPGEAPAPVDNPGNAPETVTEPTPPTEPEYTDAQLSLIAAYESGEIKERDEEFDTDPSLAFELVLSKRFVNVEEVTVKFYYRDGEEPWSTTVDKGTLADYGGPVPSIPENERAFYTFVGWQTAGGELVDLSSVNSDFELYPCFEETIKTYQITFVVDGKTTTVTLPYGELPLYTGTLEKPSTDKLLYIFEGFEPAITEVVGDATYTAIFTEKEIFPPQTGVYPEMNESDFVYRVDFSAGNEPIDISAALELGGIDSKIVIDTFVADFEIDPLSAALIKEMGATRIGLTAKTVTSLTKSVQVALFDAEGNEIVPISTFSSLGQSDILVRVDIRAPYGDAERMRIRYADGEGVYQFTDCDVEVQGNGTFISFDATPGVSYTVGSEYIVRTVSTEAATITATQNKFFAGDTVELSTVLAEGKRLVKLVYVDDKGEEQRIANSRFTLPARDVTVMAVVAQITYKVTFINDGAVLKTYRAPHGAIPIPPDEAPKKASDGEYTYTFVGWSASFDPVTSDVEYVAVYEKTAIVEDEADAAPTVSLYQLFTIAKAVAITLAVMFGIWIVVVVIRRIVRGY